MPFHRIHRVAVKIVVRVELLYELVHVEPAHLDWFENLNHENGITGNAKMEFVGHSVD